MMNSKWRVHTFLTGALMVLIVNAACAPGQAMQRDNYLSGEKPAANQEAYTFGDDDEGYKSGATVAANNTYGGQDSYNRYDQPQSRQGYSDNEDYNRYDDRRDNYNSDRRDSPRVSATGGGNYMDEPAQPRNQFDQSGPASWYGREFQGRKTASGEPFNMYQMTAAHKTYPFGTVLRVRNLDNGKEVEVRVNDRGPYREPRILDLSYEAARSLGMLAKGEAPVGITVVRMGDNSRLASDQRYGDSGVSGMADNGRNDQYGSGTQQPVRQGYQDSYDSYSDYRQPASGGNWEIQAGAFFSQNNAEKLQQKLMSMFSNRVVVFREGDLYKVRVLGISSKTDAERYRRMMLDENINGFIVPAQAR